MPNKKRYHLEYHFVPHPDGVLIGDFPEGDKSLGLTDAVVVISILRLKGGGVSFGFATRDGKEDRPLTGREMFEAWAMMAAHLAKSDDLFEGQRDMCESVWQTIRAAVLATRDDEEH